MVIPTRGHAVEVGTWLGEAATLGIVASTWKQADRRSSA